MTDLEPQLANLKTNHMSIELRLRGVSSALRGDKLDTILLRQAACSQSKFDAAKI